MTQPCLECGRPIEAAPSTGSMRPPSAFCDWCRKVAVPGKPGPGARCFKSPDDVVVAQQAEGTRFRLLVRAEPSAGRSERMVLMAFGAFALVALMAIAVKPALAIPAVLVAMVLVGAGAWLSRLAGQRSEFVVDGPTFIAKGWRGGAVQSSPKDIRELRIEGRGPSVDEGRPRTLFDISIALDDGTRHTVKTQFPRHEYAEATVESLRAAVQRAGGRA